MPTRYDYWLEGDCGVSDEQEAIADLISSYEDDEVKILDAAIMVYDSVEDLLQEDHVIALYELYKVPSKDLIGSTALKNILELAETIGNRMATEFQEMAEDEIDARKDEAEEARELLRHPEE